MVVLAPVDGDEDAEDIAVVIDHDRGASPRRQLALGIVGWLLEIARIYFVADALGIDVSFGVLMFAALANAMLTTIPIPGGFGAVEGVMIALFGVFELSDSDSISLVAVDRTISWLSVVFFGGILFVVWHTIKAKSATRDSAASSI